MKKAKKKSKRNHYQPDVVLLGRPQEDARGCYSGYAEIPGVVSAHYHLSPQHSSKYALRGTVAIIDKNSGRIMIQHAADRRDRTMKKRKKEVKSDTDMEIETGNSDELLASETNFRPKYDYGERVHVEIHCKNNITEEVIAAVTRGVLRLFEKYPRYFAEQAVKTGAIGEMFFSFAADCFKEDFRASLSCADASAATVLRNVMRVGTHLGLCKIKEIGEEEIRRVCRKLGKNYRPYLLNAARFYSWLRTEKGAVLPDSPFEAYLHSRSEKKRDHDRRRDQHNTKTVSADILSEKEELIYDRKIHSNFQDGKFVGFLVKKETGLSSEAACALRWKDVVFQEDGFVVIRHKRKEAAWEGYDMSFPTTRFFAEEIKRRRDFVLEQLDEADCIDELPVVTASDSIRKPLTSSVLNVFLGKELFTVKCYGSLVANRRSTESAGTKLLERSYEERMKKMIGTKDPGLMTFMKHELPKMVMDKYYRSYTGLAAQNAIKVMLNRDPRIKRRVFRKNRIRIDTKKVPGMTVLTAQARDPNKAQRIVLTLDARENDTIRILSHNWVKVVSMKAIEESDLD